MLTEAQKALAADVACWLDKPQGWLRYRNISDDGRHMCTATKLDFVGGSDLAHAVGVAVKEATGTTVEAWNDTYGRLAVQATLLAVSESEG